MTTKIAILPASFDPITLGHLDLIKRSAGLCDHLVILVMNNFGKSYTFSFEQRLELVRLAVGKLNLECKTTISGSTKLLVDEMEAYNADFIIRGIRNSQDLEYEKTQETINKSLAKKSYTSKDFEIVYLVSKPELAHISSTSVRHLLTNKENFQTYSDVWLSEEVIKKIKEYLENA
ncbi:pantetheine-phosphate adenylyltransferase [Psittacicella hinzii]|uniref:Phosphopantetheine adenylyltransferase n=1 Tax=Psittacicella hinzii TaxID=2028575 RepID=A0A3A1Y773_9GAMM|nr:pantetheine-phosphate adenylyltransferase [Psittacicella hinzii]RIY33119.1 pantetheine-phosphate adenylyltransferase [Psittacicella hinzii]